MEDLLDRHCPTCRARLREGAQWCPLCYADLRAATAAPVMAEPTREPSAGGAVAVPDLAEPGDGDGIDAMIAMLAAQSDPPLAGLPARLRTPHARIVVMVVGALGGTVVLLAVMLLLGQLLTG